ncbi:unknown [Clostridium sp. CAG:440]|nr:unknown [Clostridium sp. CAG:440]
MEKKIFTVKSECDDLDLDITVIKPENKINSRRFTSNNKANEGTIS